MTDFDEVLTENGFTFKRKRREELTIKTSKKIKLAQDDPKDNYPNFKNLSLKTHIDLDENMINHELSSKEIKSSKTTIEEKLISIGVIKPNVISKPYTSIDKKVLKEEDLKKKEIINKNNEKFNKEDKLLPNSNNQIVLFKGNQLTKLLSYPERTFTVVIDKEVFQKLDPFRRLVNYFDEMNISEKRYLENEYKDHKEFLAIGIQVTSDNIKVIFKL